jgi:flagellar hook protein FlgE
MAFDSLFTGITGLNAYQSWIDMISNNIANVDTIGFKGQRMTFADLFYQQFGAPSGPTQTSGGVNPLDLGLGVKINTVDTEFAQGGLQTTGINTDLALNGDGFFILRNVNGTGTPVYTRDGAFSLNSNGLLYDPASGLAVQGYMANQSGQIVNNGQIGNITIPIGLQMQATGTGFGTKFGPNANDKVFDMQLGGNLDQTQWAQQVLFQQGASATAGQPFTVTTTIYDSLGVAHQATLTFTPDAAGATPATVATNNAGACLAAPATVNPGTGTNDTITITSKGPGNGYTITDTLGNNLTASAGQQVTVGGATFTLASPEPASGNVSTVTVTKGSNGLPSSVTDAQGNARTPATRWKVSLSFSDGTTFQTIATPGSISAGGAVTNPTYGTGTSGTLGFVYFDQNGQFINSSAFENTNGNAINAATVAGFFHTAGNQPGVAQGNELDILSWGPGTGNNATAPTGTGTPATGPIGLDFSNQASLAGTFTASVVAQNGYAAGTLSNITIGQDGTVTGSFTNGQTKTLAQIALATFQNEQGLQRLGGNQFAQTAASGLAQVGTANSGRFGTIVSGALEQSNVSLATEFTNLILAQRAFEANTRGISTADQNLQTVIRLQASEN